VVVVDSWRGSCLPDLRADSRGASAIAVPWLIAETELSDEQIASRLPENLLVSAGVVARWRAGACPPPCDVLLGLLGLAGPRALPILAALAAAIIQQPIPVDC